MNKVSKENMEVKYNQIMQKFLDWKAEKLGSSEAAIMNERGSSRNRSERSTNANALMNAKLKKEKEEAFLREQQLKQMLLEDQYNLFEDKSGVSQANYGNPSSLSL